MENLQKQKELTRYQKMNIHIQLIELRVRFGHDISNLLYAPLSRFDFDDLLMEIKYLEELYYEKKSSTDNI